MTQHLYMLKPKSNIRSDIVNNNSEGNIRLQPRRPISEPEQPIMPTEPMIPTQPMMPRQPMMSGQRRTMPPCWYPPGTAFNPIGVPPWAQQPAQQPRSPVPIPGQPQIPTQPRVPTPTQPGIPVERPAIEFPDRPGPPVMVDINYLQGYLRENIGRYVRIDFLIGTTMLIDKAGELIDVGIDYVILREAETDDHDVCDLYSIKFVKVFL